MINDETPGTRGVSTDAGRMVIIPEVVHRAIHAKIDEQLLLHPEAAPDRDLFYDKLLRYFDEHKEIPSFVLIDEALK